MAEVKQKVQSDAVIVFPKKDIAKFCKGVVLWDDALSMGGRVAENTPIYTTFMQHFNEATNTRNDYASGTGDSREGEFVVRRIHSPSFNGHIAGLHQQNW